MTQKALKLALEALENIVDAIYINSQQEADAVCKANEAITAIKEALAKEKALQALHSENERLGLYKDAYAQPEQDIAELVTGMEVSIDISTGDHDSGHRLFGVVDLVQQSQGSKHGLILLVQETKANFKEALAQEQEPVAYQDTADKCRLETVLAKGGLLPQRTWVGLTRMELIKCGVLPFGMSYELYQAIEAKLKDKNAYAKEKNT